jgi:predicted transcriptional regulator
MFRPVSEVEQLVHIGANVPSSLRDELQAMADSHDRSFAAELRQAIRFYVEANSQKSVA